MTSNDFINSILQLAAERAVIRADARELTARDSATLLALLKAPPEPNEALREAARRYRELTASAGEGIERPED